MYNKVIWHSLKVQNPFISSLKHLTNCLNKDSKIRDSAQID